MGVGRFYQHFITHTTRTDFGLVSKPALVLVAPVFLIPPIPEVDFIILAYPVFSLAYPFCMLALLVKIWALPEAMAEYPF